MVAGVTARSPGHGGLFRPNPSRPAPLAEACGPPSPSYDGVAGRVSGPELRPGQEECAIVDLRSGLPCHSSPRIDPWYMGDYETSIVFCSITGQHGRQEQE